MGRRSKLNWLVPLAVIILGACALGIGIGQRTLWLPPDRLSIDTNISSLEQGANTPLLVVTPSSLTNAQTTVDIRAQSSGRILLAQARTSDIEAWVGDTAHLEVTGANQDFTQLDTRYLDNGGQTADPAGSDLWVEQQTAQRELNYQWQAPDAGPWSLLLASDGTAPAVESLSVSVPNDTSTPWAVPLMVIGGIVILLGLLLWIFLLSPKRKRSSGRRSAGAALVLLLAGVVGFSGLLNPVRAEADESSPAPQSSDAATTSTSSSSEAANTSPTNWPVLTDEQFTRILTSVADTVARGDAAKDIGLIGQRIGGQARQDRAANYKVLAQAPDSPAREAVAADPVLSRFVPVTDAWPRTVVAVTQSDANNLPQALVLTQSSPRDNYQLTSTMRILPGMTLPAPAASEELLVANDESSAVATSPETALSNLATLLGDPNGSVRGLFAESAFVNDTKALQDSLRSGSPDADFTFTHEVVPQSLVSFKGSDGSVVVFGNLNLKVQARPKSENAVLNLTDPASQALAGGNSSENGFNIDFTEQAIVVIPPASESKPISIVGAERVLVAAALE